MSANSSLLFLLNNETHETESSGELETENLGCSTGCVVEAGTLRIRLTPGGAEKLPHDASSYSPEIVLPETEFPEIEWNVVESSIPATSDQKRSRMGVNAHLLQMGGAVARVFAVLAGILIVGGFCSFLIGVAIPFGLFR